METAPIPELDYKKLFDEAPGVYLILAPDDKFTILGTNKARDLITGRDRSQVIGHGVFEAFPDDPSDPEANGVANLRASLQEVLKTKKPHRMAIQKYSVQRMLEGINTFEVRYWSPLNIPVLDAHGKIEYIIHHVEEVTELIHSQDQVTNQVQFNRELRKEIEERKRVEARLRESEMRFRAIFNNSMDGIILKHPHGPYEMANPAAYTMLGYISEDELLNVDRNSVIDEDSPEVQEFLKIRNEQGQARSELILRKKNGMTFPVEISSSLFKDEKGKTWSSVIFRDITERKEIEAEHMRWMSIAEMTPDFMARIDPKGNIVYINNSWRELLGLGEAKIKKLTLKDVHTTDSAAELLTEGIPGAVKNDIWVSETYVLNHKKEAIPVSELILAHRNKKAEVEYFTIIARDISDRKHKEDAQRFLAEASKALMPHLDQLQTLQVLANFCVPHLADLSVVVLEENGSLHRQVLVHHDPEKQFYLEQTSCCLGGKDSSVGIWKVIRSGISELVPEVVDAWMIDALASEEQFQAFKKLKVKSLIIVPLKTRESTLGAVWFASSTRHYDKVDLELAEELVARAGQSAENALLYQQSREAIQIRDEVLRVVAHDLRNPLNTISISADSLNKGLPPELERMRRFPELIKKSLERADHLIQDLLDIAKLQAKTLSIEKESIQTKEFIQEIVEANQDHMAKLGLKFSVDHHGTLPNIVADKNRLFQIFSNLIGNAAKFTSRGGTITIKTKVEKHHVKFSVCDTGMKIPTEQVPYLFVPFWQAKSSHNKEGAGLGLPITKALVEAHGGKIWFEDNGSEGKAFTFILPLGEPMKHEDVLH